MVVIDTHIVIDLKQEIRFVDYAIGIFPQLQTKNAIKKAIKRQSLLLNGDLANQGWWIKEHDKIELVDPGHRIPKPYDFDVPIVYEDDYLLVVNKPSGLTVSGNKFETLENALVNRVKLSVQPDDCEWVNLICKITSQLV